MKSSYTIKGLIVLLLSKIWMIIISTVCFGTAAFVAAEFIIPLKYQSYTTMYVKNIQSTDNRTDYNVDLSDLNASKSLLSTYIAVLKSNSIMDEVGRRLLVTFDEDHIYSMFPRKNGKINPDAIKSCFSMSSVDATEVMKISAVTEDPEVSAEMCNIIADLAPEFLIRVVGAGSVEIIDYAVPDYSPVSPNVPLITLMGLLAGMCAAVLIILLIDFFDDTVKETDEVAEKFGKSILGEIQNMSGEKGDKVKKGKGKKNRIKITDKKMLINEGILFNVTETYKSIRTNIIFSLGTSDKKIIAVSSPNPSEGKSITSANVAIVFAQTDNKVLLIDADMRKPVQHKLFKISNNAGLSTLIIKQTTIEDSIRRDVVSGVDLLPSGPLPPNPSELLASDHFSQLIEQLSLRYDYIIIDTPPINVVSDAMVISKIVSGIMMVLKYGSTTFRDMEESVKQMELADANLLGFVLNDIRRSHGSSYYNYKYKYKYRDYSYGYGYGSQIQPEESDGDE